MPLSGPPNASNTLNRCSVCIILLNKEELRISVENKNVRIGYLFDKACEHLAIKETEYFGLALQKDGEFSFLKVDAKLQKFASKLWKSKHSANDCQILTFYLRIQYYVDSIGLFRDPIVRHQYYLQLRDNLLHYGQINNEEKCFVLASYALQADFGPYRPDIHTGAYFDPHKYFPAWVIMRRGEKYITANLPIMHKELSSVTKAEARSAFIRELLSSPVRHNFHLYRLRRRKHDNVSALWIAVCPKGLEVLEEVNAFKNQMAVFLWQNIEKLHCDNKKFEIVTDALMERKFSYYTSSKESGDHLLNLCRSTHHFQMALQPRLAEIQHQEAQDQRYRELYVHWGHLRCSQDDQKQKRTTGSAGITTDASLSFDANRSPTAFNSSFGRVQKDVYLGTPNGEGSDDKEIIIASPPLMSSTLTTISPMTELSQSPLWLSTASSDLSNGLEQMSSSAQIKSHNEGSFNSKHPVKSFSKSNSSDESLITGSLCNSDSPSVGQLHLSFPSSPALQIKHWSADMKPASSVYSMASWLSTSPNSSTSSSQLVFSLPAKSTMVDAASLRKSLPHGKTLNEYISQIMSGEDTDLMMSEFQKYRHRKSSLDQLKPCLTHADGDNFLRSASLRQTEVESVHERGSMYPFGGRFSKDQAYRIQSGDSLSVAHHLPQNPVAAHVQKIMIPKRMTAVSAAVRSVPNHVFSEQVDPGREYFGNRFPSEKPMPLFPPLHSTPIASRFPMQEICSADVPVSSSTSSNSFNLCFSSSPTVPSVSFHVPTVLTPSDLDYCGKYYPPVLGYNQNGAAKLSTIGELEIVNGKAQDSASEPSYSWLVHRDPLPQINSKPPAYSEWQAAKALTVLNAERMRSWARPSGQNEDQLVDGELLYPPQNGFANGIFTDENSLSHTSYPGVGDILLNSVGEFPTQTAVTNICDVTFSKYPSVSQVSTDQASSLASDNVSSIAKGFDHYSAERSEFPSPLAFKTLTEKQRSQSSGKLVTSRAISEINMQDRLHNTGSNNLPFLNALLKDRSLLTFNRNEVILQLHKNLFEDPDVKTAESALQPKRWHHHRNELICSSEPDLFRENSRLMTVGGGAHGFTSGNGMRLHSVEAFRMPSAGNIYYHNQSHSDSVVLPFCPIVA